MRTFLRNIRKSLTGPGSARKYILYAIGEIALVVIGILIALQINNWNQDKQTKRQEEILLTEMVKNLKQDLTTFENQLNYIQSRYEKVKTLSILLKDESTLYHDSLLNYFADVWGFVTIRLNTAMYEDLKSRGFGLIRDDALRLGINRFFEEAINRLNTNQSAEGGIQQDIKPYYLKYFQDIQFGRIARPIDVQFILNDIHYENLVDYRIIVLENISLTFLPLFIEEMEGLIQNIESYLADGN